MKALVKTEAARGLSLIDVDEPTIGPNDVLIKVRKAAICGTDLHIYDWDPWAQKTIPVPLTVGHEFMGEVVEVGSHAYGFEVGDRVSGEGHITCGACRNCRAGKRHLCRNTVGIGVNRSGCFADYLALPASNAFKLPPKIGDEVASFLDPLGNAVHTALSFDLVGEDVLITGCGPIGCMAVAIARHVGARYIVATDINPLRLQMAKNMGANIACDVRTSTPREAMDTLGMTEGYDVGLEMSGHKSALESMLATMNHGGKIAALGIPSGAMDIDWNELIFKGLTIKGIYGRRMFETWYKMATMLMSGLDVTPVLTHRFARDDYEAAFDTVKKGDGGKVILEWS